MDHQKAGRRARTRGQVGERQFAKWLRENNWFPKAFRGRQYQGRSDAPDVGGTPGVHFEVKWVEKLHLHAALKQAMEECGDNVPVVASRRNHDRWVLSLYADDLRRLILALQKES